MIVARHLGAEKMIGRPPVCRHGQQCGTFWCRNAAFFIVMIVSTALLAAVIALI